MRRAVGDAPAQDGDEEGERPRGHDQIQGHEQVRGGATGLDRDAERLESATP